MTSLTGQFLNKLRGNVPLTSESPTPPITSLTPSGENFNDAPSTEPTTTEEDMRIKMTRKGETLRLTAETVGIVLGMIAGGTVSILLGGLIIHWILVAINLSQLTYWQIVGLLVIWEMIKPRNSSS